MNLLNPSNVSIFFTLNKTEYLNLSIFHLEKTSASLH